CETAACTFQTCISKNTYNQEKCDAYLRKLYLCCQSMYEGKARAESTACPKLDVVKRWLKNHPENS
ncbi:hypothetical protein PILCRDRAFT_70494, partial [Piloderma croceum F 1598]